MDPIQKLLNALISQNLGAINQGLQGAIVKNNLDPLVSVTSGSETLGSIDLGICTAGAKAGYSVSNLRGLASCRIDSLQITSAAQAPGAPDKVVGSISLTGSVASALGADLGGRLKAGCGFISDSVGISGSVQVSGATLVASGHFLASTQNAQLVLSQLDVDDVSFNYGSLSANIDGLGFFNSLLDPLKNLILGLFKGDIRSLIGRALTPVINSQLDAALPLSTKL